MEINNIWHVVDTIANEEKEYTFSDDYRVDTKKNHERSVRKNKTC